MFTVIPTADQLTRARRRERFMVEQTIERHGQEYLKNSILEGEGTIYGLVVEEILRDIYRTWRPSKDKDIFDYDLYDDEYLGSVEVKTKRCTSAPQFNYNCTVSAANYTQRCDYYLFSRIHMDFSKAYIIGLLPSHIFREPGRAVFARKGEEDPQRPGWHFKWDCYNIAVADLWPAPPTTDYFANFKYRPAESGVIVCS